MEYVLRISALSFVVCVNKALFIQWREVGFVGFIKCLSLFHKSMGPKVLTLSLFH